MALPPSPTLTNPDMILPYGPYDDTTPSPPRVGAWTVRPEDMDFSQGLTYGIHGGAPMVPITPIIYGNGTMLSDIGEVTEAESTVMGGIGARRMQVRMNKSGGNTPMGSSPTVPYQSLIMKKKAISQHKRNVSSESGSTVLTERDNKETTDHFKDFDDTVSVCESAFQGDDEESLADYSFGEPMVAETRKIYGKRESKLIDMQKQKEEEELSSAALSRRAEMILANAKKRLDNMEGNLNRARSSLHITPSASMSSIHSSSPLSRETPSPPIQRVMSQNGTAPAKHRQLNHTSLQTFGHQRISSENSLPSPVKAAPTSRTFLSGKPLDPSPRYSMPARADSYDSGRSLPTMQSRNSDPSAVNPGQESGSGSDDRGRSPFGHDRYVRSATAEPSYHHEIHRQGLERSSSQMEMRDLTDKMKDLKGKISNLRDRAREDHLKRRSASNLRTPSPFTAAEQWYTSSNDYKDGHLTADAIAHDQWNEQANGNVEPPRDILISENGRVADDIAEEYEESVATTVYHEVEDEHSEVYDNVATSFGDADPLNQRAIFEADESEAETEERNTSMMDDYADELIEQEEANEAANERGYDSDGGESIYHDTHAAPVLSHEERADAFDYEHFFLHSAMGSMTRERQRRRGSVGSDMSDDSAATERAVEVPSAAPPVSYTPPVSYNFKDQLKPTHKRQQSQDTISTMATFATAQGEPFSQEDSDDEEISDYDIQGVFPLIPGQEVVPPQVPPKDNAFDTKRSSPTIPDEQPERPKTPPYQPKHHSRRSSVVFQMKDGVVQRSTVHRPSVSSFHSVTSGSVRSFPLINKPKGSSTASNPSSIKTPSIRSAPSHIVDANGDDIPGMALTTEDDGVVDQEEERKEMEARLLSPVSMLRRDEQIMVERLVASMGKCVLALQESREGTVEHRLWRRRLDAARRVLEGIEGAV